MTARICSCGDPVSCTARELDVADLVRRLRNQRHAQSVDLLRWWWV